MITNKEHSANFEAHLKKIRKSYEEDKPVEALSIDTIKHILIRDDDIESVFIDILYDSEYNPCDGYYIRERDGIRFVHKMTAEEINDIDEIYYGFFE